MNKITLQLQHLIQAGGTTSSVSDSSNLAQSSNSLALMTLSPKNSFIIDSGAIDHICGTSYGLSDFHIIAEGSRGPITVANGTQVPVKG